MSGTVIKEFLVQLGFDVDKSGADGFNSAIINASKTALAMGAAIATASAAVTAFVSKMAGEMDALVDVAEMTNTTAEAIDKLGYVAELSDSSFGAVTQSLKSVAANAGQTALGIGRAKVVFEEIGISVTDANGKLKDSSALMAEVGDKVKDMEKGKQIAIFEKLGIDATLIKTLTGDVGELQAQYDAMMTASGMNFNEAAAAASEFEDSQISLGLTLKKLQQVVASKFFRYFSDSFKKLNEWIVLNMPRIVAAITPVITTVMVLAETFVQLGKYVVDAISFILGGLSQLNDLLDGIPGYIALAVAGWYALNAAFMASPMGLAIAGVVALAAAIALLVDDFNVWKEGGKSFLPWQDWIDEIDKVKTAFTEFMNWLQPYTDIIFNLFDKLGSLGSFIGQNIPVSIPSVGGAGTRQSVNQQTVINVNGGDPQATARAVAGQQDSVNANMTRNLKGATQ